MTKKPLKHPQSLYGPERQGGPETVAYGNAVFQIYQEELGISQTHADEIGSLITSLSREPQPREELRSRLAGKLNSSADFLLASATVNQFSLPENINREQGRLNQQFGRYLERIKKEALPVPNTNEFKALIRAALLDDRHGQAAGYLRRLLRVTADIDQPGRQPERGEAAKKAFAKAVDLGLDISYNLAEAMLLELDQGRPETAAWSINFWFNLMAGEGRNLSAERAFLLAALVYEANESPEETEKRLYKAMAIQGAVYMAVVALPDADQKADSLGKLMHDAKKTASLMIPADKNQARIQKKTGTVGTLSEEMIQHNQTAGSFDLSKGGLIFAFPMGPNGLTDLFHQLWIKRTREKLADSRTIGDFVLPYPNGLEMLCLYELADEAAVLRVLREKYRLALNGELAANYDTSKPRRQLTAADLDWVLTLLGPSHLINKFTKAFRRKLGAGAAESSEEIGGEIEDRATRTAYLRQIQQSGRGLGTGVYLPLSNKPEEAPWGMTGISLRPAGKGEVAARVDFGVCHADFRIVPGPTGYDTQGLEKLSPPQRIFLEKVVFAHWAFLIRAHYHETEKPPVVRKGTEEVSLATAEGQRIVQGQAHFRAMPVGYVAHYDAVIANAYLESTFGPDIRADGVAEGYENSQEDLATLNKLSPVLADKVAGRLKAVLTRKERPRFFKVTRPDGRQQVRLFIGLPGLVEEIDGAEQMAGKLFIRIEPISEQDFEPAGILADNPCAQDVITFQRKLLPADSQTAEPVMRGTKRFYHTTVVIQTEMRAEKQDGDVIVNCPQVLADLKWQGV